MDEEVVQVDDHLAALAEHENEDEEEEREGELTVPIALVRLPADHEEDPGKSTIQRTRKCIASFTLFQLRDYVIRIVYPTTASLL